MCFQLGGEIFLFPDRSVREEGKRRLITPYRILSERGYEESWKADKKQNNAIRRIPEDGVAVYLPRLFRKEAEVKKAGS